ncbi:MAG: SDR family oxidoreductase [Pseudomonadota bacterium]
MTDRKLMLVTGASAGIGAEFARQYAARGWDVALTARRADRLETLAAEIKNRYNVEALVVAQDLAASDSVDKILAEIDAVGRHVDGVINNAGYGLTGTFFNTNWQDQADFLRVLFSAPIELTHKVLPGMAERGFGRIINVASLAGYTPGSNGHTLYAGVKSGLIKFSESIAAEAKAAGHDNVHCTALCPGFTWSEFHDVNGTRDATNEMPKWMWMDAEPVVEAGIEACERGQPVIVPGTVNKGLATLSRVLPEPIGRKIVAAQSKRYRKAEG